MLRSSETSVGGIMVRSSRSPSATHHHQQQLEEEVKDLLNEISDLKDENDKLRQIQEQFWLLLFEKEDLQRELETQRAAASSLHRTNIAPTAPVSSCANGATSDDAVRRAEHDAMTTALNECLELLMAKEQISTLQQTEIGSRGTVHAFLSWLNFSHERATARNSLVSARDEVLGSLSPGVSKTIGTFSPTYGVGGISKEEKEQLLRELHHAKQEIKQLQDELDRTDMSRLQALEDAERMQQQIEVLSSGVHDLRQAYNAVKVQAEANTKTAQQVQQLKAQLAQRDSQIHELKAQLAQFRRLGDVGGAELAADAARIRQQLAQRTTASAHHAQDIMLSP